MPATNRTGQVPVTSRRCKASAQIITAMNLAQLQTKLIDAARKNPPGDQVPYAFEKRIMARLAAVPRFDEWAQWVRSWWYGAAVCAAVALCLSVWSFAPDDEQELAANFSQDLEQTILPADDADSTW